MARRDSLYRSVVLATDGTDATRAAAQLAAMLAARHEARLYVVHVFTGRDRAEESAAAGTTCEFAQRRLDEETGEARRSLVTLARGREGDPANEIVALAAEKNADLIVLGTHQRAGLLRWLRGSVAERVIQKAACPVLVVPPRSSPRDVGAPFAHRVLVALADSEPPDETLANVLSLAGHDVDVVRVGEPEEILREATRSQAYDLVGCTEARDGVHALGSALVRRAREPVLVLPDRP